MEEFKDYPTDEDYNRAYWQDFLKKQKAHRADLERLAKEAVETNNLAWLQNQMIILGIHQAQIKQCLIREVFKKPCLTLDWGEKTDPQLRRIIMKQKCEVPKWQRREALYIIDMYHDIMEEMSHVLKTATEVEPDEWRRGRV